MPGQLWQAPLFCLGLLALTMVAASTPFRQDPALRQFRNELAQLRQGLAPGKELPENLVAQADLILLQLDSFSRLGGEVYFLAGSAYYRMAESLGGTEGKAARERAVELFEKAMGYQIPDRDWPALQFRLGLCLHRLERDLERAVELMARSAERGADTAAEGYGLLVQAYLRQPRPDWDAALAANQKQLEQIDDARGLAMMRARLVRGEILLQRGQRAEAMRELDRISAEAADEVRLPARFLQIRCAEEDGQWTRALTWWKELLTIADQVPGGKGRILLAIGACHAQGDRPDPDQAAQAWQEALALGGGEAQAAAWRLGALRLEYEPAKSLEWWAKSLESVRSAHDLVNPLLDIKLVRDTLDQACRRLLELGHFDHAQQAAQLYQRIALPGKAEEWLAQIGQTQAKDLLERATAAPGDQAKTLREQSHLQFHQAGVAYERAAALRGDQAEADLYWRSAQCYLQAEDSAKAIIVLEQFVRLEKNDVRLAEGWFSLAEARQRQGAIESAYQAYYKCIEFPASPLAFRARYQIAVRELDNKNLEQCREILQQILSATGQVDRDTHEKSIFKMAGLLLQMQIHDKAAWYLKEAIRQYPSNLNVLSAQDQLGNCYRKLADQAERKLEDLDRAALPNELTEEKKAAREEKRAHYRRTRRGWLEQALASYQALKVNLEDTARQKPLSPTEAGFLRKALFSLADIRFDLNEYPEALRRYQELQSAYRNQVEGLVACYKVWSCVGTMVQTPEARRLAIDAAKKSVELALADLEKMDKDHPGFTGSMDVWTKPMWETELRRIQQQLRLIGEPARPGVVGFP